jgi:hypothetical protein
VARHSNRNFCEKQFIVIPSRMGRKRFLQLFYATKR